MKSPRSKTNVLLVLSCACVMLASCDKSQAQSPPASDSKAEKTPLEVEVVAAEKKTRPISLTLDGTLVADAESRVTSVVAGRVVEVFVERGSKVAANAPLLKLRDVDYRFQAKAARAQLEQARARLGMGSSDAPPKPTELPEVEAARSEMELADQDLARIEELASADAASPQQLDAARARATGARNRYQNAINQAQAAVSALDVARVSLNQANSAISETTVRAPFAGEIADRMVSVGEYVAPQSPLVTLVRTDPLRIELSVPQQHLRAVEPGQTVTLTVDALPGQTFEATVRYVSASVARSTRALTVEAVVPNSEGFLRPGLFASARLETGGESDAAVIPAAAVRTSAGVSRVFVVEDDVIVERVISIADRNADEVVVAEGIRPGDRVAVEKLDQLADGLKVAPSERKA